MLMKTFDRLIFFLFGRIIARRFVVFGGVSAALAHGEGLVMEGITPTYNRIDEHVKNKEHVERILCSYIELVRAMDATNKGHVAIKPSAFGIGLGSYVFARTLRRFIEAVSDKSLEIEIDAEDRGTLFAVQRVLNSLVFRLPKGIRFRPAFQMHLPENVRKELITQYRILDMPVRIVKGSGLYDIGAPELNDKEVLARYAETFQEQIAKKKHPNIATMRDRELIDSLVAIAVRERVSFDRFTIQFLDGPIGHSLARVCVDSGCRVGCYVTFVDPSAPNEWKGYVRRRIAFGRKFVFGK
ncbi:MAG: hypothetical protein A2942_02175 [Candidatus Lloydbacteria bacterium RIFCSPLOWO2_01_FULL_50_20]|uniref:Uncharacterized protein n=1 Tax=Candidatus Lloydbacteria bacterium RIFCSPLOWO2_01_FULL_50_20 TaxID=1798665 RepID=A0A1G2DJB3_9BACT|nr:MAG: hypothetical protein A3C13_04745 [Candidatus Lloydbacteria bacterium RIFCSPHIGHO2_02_FULL_50_11]OGZ13757.1 MAG: hypothetical protein A2942_02175 [Candidatus Lloydbacteria bacterium RIFCSPLOWO2_01_FULL_50_20]